MGGVENGVETGVDFFRWRLYLGLQWVSEACGNLRGKPRGNGVENGVDFFLVFLPVFHIFRGVGAWKKIHAGFHLHT